MSRKYKVIFEKETFAYAEALAIEGHFHLTKYLI